MKRLRVLFMGTPTFAVASLRAIVAAGHDVPLVVTTPDRPQGRGRRLQPSAVRAAAEELGLEVATPERLDEPEFLERVRSLAPEVICVVAFRILPPDLYSIPSRGSFNLHGSLLPRYRGAAPINRAIMAGDRETGVTTFFLQRKVDTGTMILQRPIAITPEMTAGELHDVMMEVGASAVVETLELIAAGDVAVTPQEDALATPAPKIFRDDCRIDWRQSAEKIHDQVRGLSPTPGAFTTLDGATFKVFRSRVADGAGPLAPGEIRVDGERMLVGTGSEPLELLVVQQEGKRAIDVSEFLRGFRPTAGTMMEVPT